MPILSLILTHRWYDKIANGEKRYEYREIKPFWQKRLFARSYSAVRFHRGYTSTTMCFELLGIDETTAPNDLNLPHCYRLRLGERIQPSCPK